MSGMSLWRQLERVLHADALKKTAIFGIGGTVAGIIAESIGPGGDPEAPELDISYSHLGLDPQIVHILAEIGGKVPVGVTARIPYLGIIHNMDKLVGFKHALVRAESVSLTDRVDGYNLYMSVANSIRQFLEEIHDNVRGYEARDVVHIERQVELLTMILSSYYGVVHSLTQDGRIR